MVNVDLFLTAIILACD